MRTIVGIRPLVTRQGLVALLIGGLIHTTTLAGPVMAMSPTDTQVGQVRRAVAAMPTGPEALVAVTLKNRTTVTGYVERVGASSFIVTDPATGVSTQVPYANVRVLNKMSTGAKIQAGVVGAVVLLWLFYQAVRGY